jgi:hypothetical protein
MFVFIQKINFELKIKKIILYIYIEAVTTYPNTGNEVESPERGLQLTLIPPL